MRYVAYGFVCFVIFFYSIQLMLMVDVECAQKAKLQEALIISMKQVMWQILQGDISLEEGAKQELNEQLCCTLAQEEGVDVDVVYIDVEEGIMAVKVGKEFTYPNGKQGVAIDKKMVIIESNFVLRRRRYSKYSKAVDKVRFISRPYLHTLRKYSVWRRGRDNRKMLRKALRAMENA